MKKLATLSGVILLWICIVGAYANAQTKGQSALVIADSLFTKQDWKTAKQNYVSYLGDTSINSRAWNRLGYCNQNLGLYNDAIKDYNKALANNPTPPVRNVAMARMARVYSLMNKTAEATDWLLKATATGYNSLPDLDTLADFKNLRSASDFTDIRKKVYAVIYPCSAEPHSHDFDFWIGDWDVYQTGTQFLVGHSHVESISGGCAILENWSSTQAQTGKSINYYDPSNGKWQQDWIGSGGGPQRYLDGEYKDGAMHFTYESITKGKKSTGNFKFYNVDKDTVRQYQDVINDDGKTVTVSYDLTYVRKKK